MSDHSPRPGVEDTDLDRVSRQYSLGNCAQRARVRREGLSGSRSPL